MSIEIVCSSRELFGADRAALRLAETLASLGQDPYLVLPEGRPDRGLAQAADAAQIRWVERLVPLATSSGLQSVSGISRTRGPFNEQPAVSIINSASILAGAARGAAKVLIVREWLDPGSPKHRLLVLRHRFGLDVAVGVSSGVLQQWRRCVRGPRHQRVVNDWLDDNAIDLYSAGVRERSASIVCVGRFNQWKGQEILADAFERSFRGAALRPELTFVGAQPGTEFEQRAADISQRGAEWGWAVESFVSDPSKHFKSAALFVLPSMRPEPFGLVLLEALAAGCAVIAFEGGGPNDLASRFPGVVRLVKRDPAALAAALTQWWREGGLSQRSGEHQATLKILKDRFSPTAAESSWRAILGSISAHRLGARP